MEDYIPQRLKELFLPRETKEVLQEMVRSGRLSNMIIYGQPGIGKTSCADILIRELKIEHVLRINGSLDRTLRLLKLKITDFVKMKTRSQKVIVIDEADALTMELQYALRRIVETSSVCFVLICNYIEKIIEPLKSRLLMLRFNVLPFQRYLRFVTKVHALYNSEPLPDATIIQNMYHCIKGDMRKTIMIIKNRLYADYSQQANLEVQWQRLLARCGESCLDDASLLRLLYMHQCAAIHIKKGGDLGLNVHIMKQIEESISLPQCASPTTASTTLTLSPSSRSPP